MKINQSDTSIDHYNEKASRDRFGFQAKLVLEVLRGSSAPMTLSEIAKELHRRAYPLPDSTISGRVNELKNQKFVTDENEKRPCSVTGKRKKTWKVLKAVLPGEGEQGGLFSRN